MLSRVERERKAREDDTYQPDMPPLECGAYLIAYLFEVGPVMSGGMGPVPLTHGELRCWQDNIGLQLQPWEARFLRRLSREYAAEMHRAEKADAPAPWEPTDYTPDFSGVALDMRAQMRAEATM
jgi:hypothetical protein